MTEVVASLSGLLAAVFATSGALKVRHPFPSALALRRFGLVRRLRPRLGRALGAAELALAAALIFSPRPQVPLLLAAILLLAFVVLIGRALLRGERFACGCFGEGAETISWTTAGRTASLLGAAALALGAALTTGVEIPLEIRVQGASLGVLALGAVALGLELRRTRPFSTRLEPEP
jgi:hypothetical protein